MSYLAITPATSFASILLPLCCVLRQRPSHGSGDSDSEEDSDEDSSESSEDEAPPAKKAKPTPSKADNSAPAGKHRMWECGCAWLHQPWSLC